MPGTGVRLAFARVRAHLRRRETLMLAGVACLVHGATVNLGDLSAQALGFVLLGAGLLALAMHAPNTSQAGTGTWVVAAAACALTGIPVAQASGMTGELWLAVAITLGVVALLLVRGLWRWAAAALAVAAIAASAALLWRWGRTIDVFHSVQAAAAALLHGRNPYLTTFLTPNQLSPHAFVEARVHFQYLPGAALLAVPGRLLGDVRVMSALAIAAFTASAVALARAGEVDRRRILALCLASPMVAVMVVFAWVDVFSVAGIAMWLALRGRHPRGALVCLALGLAVKPTTLIALVPLLVWSRPARRELLAGGAAAAALSLPFVVITGPAAFYHDVIGVQTQLGFRWSGLTLNAWIAGVIGAPPPPWFDALLAMPVAVTALARRPRDLTDMLLAGAVLSTAAFLLAKWAFLNYYFLPVCLVLLAIPSRGSLLERNDVGLPLPRVRAEIAARIHGLLDRRGVPGHSLPA